MSTEERALIARASRGDVEAFSKLVSAHSALVRGVTLRMLGPRRPRMQARRSGSGSGRT